MTTLLPETATKKDEVAYNLRKAREFEANDLSMAADLVAEANDPADTLDQTSIKSGVPGSWEDNGTLPYIGHEPYGFFGRSQDSVNKDWNEGWIAVFPVEWSIRPREKVYWLVGPEGEIKMPWERAREESKSVE